MSGSGENEKFVTLIASLEGVEPIRRRVRKDVIQSESVFLKEYIDDGAKEIRIPLRRPKNLNSILKYFYEEKLTVSKESHLETLWNDARILGLVNLEKVCIDRLTDTISLDSWIQRLEFARTEDCHELESNVLSFVNDNFENCSSSSSLKLLSVDQMVKLLQLPTVKATVTESSMIALILDWIKTNENDRFPQAHRLLEQVDLMKLPEDSLRSIFDEESAFRNWRSVAIFERAIRVKKLGVTARHSDTVRSRLVKCEPSAAHPVTSGTVEIRRVIKQEVVSVESSDAEDGGVNESQEDVSKTSAPERTFRIKQEFIPSSSTSVSQASESNDNADGDSSAPKRPRLEHSQADPVARNPPRVPNQKQILYLRQNGEHSYNLNAVILNADSVTPAERVQVDLPDFNNHIPKLIWSEEARGLFLLGQVSKEGRILSTVLYMNGQRPLNVTEVPRMLVGRHRFQPSILNGRLYAIGGSKWVRLKNRSIRSQGEVLDMTAVRAEWQWQPIERMPMKCDLFTAAVAEGRIYIIGGLRDSAEEGNNSKPVATNEVICYDPTSNKWEFVRRMGISRCGHASAVVGRRIFVFGGCNKRYRNPHKDLINMRTAEVYDIEENKWAVIAPMRRPRFGCSALEMDGKIYVFGGDYNGEGKIAASVECYNPVSDSWIYVSTIIDSQGVFDSIAVIDNPECFL